MKRTNFMVSVGKNENNEGSCQAAVAQLKFIEDIQDQIQAIHTQNKKISTKIDKIEDKIQNSQTLKEAEIQSDVKTERISNYESNSVPVQQHQLDDSSTESDRFSIETGFHDLQSETTV